MENPTNNAKLPPGHASRTIVPNDFLETELERTSGMVNVFGQMSPMTEEQFLSSNFDELRDLILWAESENTDIVEEAIAWGPEKSKLTWLVAAMFNRSFGSQFTSDEKSENGKNYRTERLKGLKHAIKAAASRDMPDRFEEQLLRAWSPYKLAGESAYLRDTYLDASIAFFGDDTIEAAASDPRSEMLASSGDMQAFLEKPAGPPNSSTTSQLFQIQELCDLITGHVLPQECDEPVTIQLNHYEQEKREEDIQARRNTVQSLRSMNKEFNKSANERLFKCYTFRPLYSNLIEIAGSLIKFEQRTQGPAAEYVQQLKLFNLSSMRKLGAALDVTFRGRETFWRDSAHEDEETRREAAELTDTGETWLLEAIQRLPNLKSITTTLDSAVSAFWELAKMLSNFEHNVTELVLLTGMPTLMYDPIANVDITGGQGGNFLSKIKSLKVHGRPHDDYVNDSHKLDAYDTPLGKICREISMPNLSHLELDNITKHEVLPLPTGELPSLRSISLDRLNLTANDLLQLLSKSKMLEKVNLTGVKLTAGFWAPCLRRLTELLEDKSLKVLILDDLGYYWGGPSWEPFSLDYVLEEEFRNDRIGPLCSINPADRKALSAFVTAHKAIWPDARILSPAFEVVDKFESRPIKFTRCAGMIEGMGRCEKDRILDSDEIACEVGLCKDHRDQIEMLRYYPYGEYCDWIL